MRLAIFALLLFSGTVAFCQSAVPAPVNPGQHWLTPPGTAQPGRDFTTPPPDWHFYGVVPPRTLILPNAGPLRPRGDARIDPKMIVHPPPSSLGEQPPGTMVAQNLYPGLQLLPIEGAKARAIPTIWPNLKVQQIPTAWPKCAIKPVEIGAAGQPAGK